MATKIDAGALNNNPGTGVKSPRKKQVTPTQASTTDTAATASPALTPARVVLQSVLVALMGAAATFQPFVRVIPAGDRQRRGKVSSVWEAGIPAVAALLRQHPELAAAAPGCSPDALVTDVAYVADLRHLAGVLQEFLNQTQDTVRLTLGDARNQAAEVYALARRRAKQDPSLATQVAPLQQSLKRVPAVTAAGNQAHAAQQSATRSTQQAAKQGRKADLAKLAATVAEARANAAVPVPASNPAPVR